MPNLVPLSMNQGLNRKEIWLANLNPSKGTEPGKTRPVLILQSQVLLTVYHPSTLIIPLTTHLIEDSYPLRVRALAQGQLVKDSDLLIDQIRAIDNQRLVDGPLAILTDEYMRGVEKAIGEVLGMYYLNQVEAN